MIPPVTVGSAYLAGSWFNESIREHQAHRSGHHPFQSHYNYHAVHSHGHGRGNPEVLDNLKHEVMVRVREGADAARLLFNAHDTLFPSIRAMHDYGVLLQEQGVVNGEKAMRLATELMTRLEQFLDNNAALEGFDAFQADFLELLHSEDEAMSTYRVAWETLAANIAIALTGIGLFAIAGQLIYSKATEGRALFFFQQSKTTSEEKIQVVEQGVNVMEQLAPGVL